MGVTVKYLNRDSLNLLHDQMRIDEYKVLSECVEKGIDYGYMRAHKYTDLPTDQGIKDAIHDAVMNEVCEYFHFNEHQQENTDSAAKKDASVSLY
jgi:hypothetical protein